MTKYYWLYLLLFSASCSVYGQHITGLLDDYNDQSVPYISAQSLSIKYSQYVVLDARTRAEYEVSHLPRAIWVGEQLDTTLIKDVSTDQPIVVYCSVGVRSEDYGTALINLGYRRVYNLFGGVFNWKDADYQVVNLSGQPTDSVHVYSNKWQQYLKTGVKVY